MNGNNLSHIAPHDAVQQPGIQLGTAIDGKRFSGSALDGVQKLLRVRDFSPSRAKKEVLYRLDSSKPGPTGQCGGGHTRRKPLTAKAEVPRVIRIAQGTCPPARGSTAAHLR